MKQRKERRVWFKSIYARFTLVFLGIWWSLNAITFSAIITILQNSNMDSEFQYIQQLTGFVYLSSAFFGTIIILLAVRSIIKPIKKISMAAREVARGNLDVQVDVKNDDEIGHLADDFNMMVKEINSLDTLRSDFVSNVSHEFRTPITSIKGYARLIDQDKTVSEHTKKLSKVIMDESDLLIGLSSNLLRLSELDAQVIHQTTTFGLDEQIRQVIVFLQPVWEPKDIEFDIDLDEIEYTGDEELLRQVWLNLIQNAIKFTNDKGVIQIDLKDETDNVSVCIKDSGVGMASEEIPHIFDRFYKGDKARKGKGNGLGLSIVMKILEQADGTISVSSKVGSGTTVKVELPKK